MSQQAKIKDHYRYSQYLKCSALYFECPKTQQGIIQLANILSDLMDEHHTGYTFINVKLVESQNNNGHTSSHVMNGYSRQIVTNGVLSPKNGLINGVKGDDYLDEYEDSWKMWSDLRSIAAPLQKLVVSLELTEKLPSEEEQKRWLGEPIRLLVIPTKIYGKNGHGYPVLSKDHQHFIQRLIDVRGTRISIMIKGRDVHGMGSCHYSDFIYELLNHSLKEEKMFAEYEDILSYPLEPLTSNLDVRTYSEFAIDPFKYNEYMMAIEAALNRKTPRPVVVGIFGAGKGRLIESTIRAAKSTQIPVCIYAVEKNPYACISLDHMKKNVWNNLDYVDSITVIQADMRGVETPKKCDIIVSELLGSFGCNELSPECLDGVWKSATIDTICIPQSYSSYIQPIMSHRLYTNVCNTRGKDCNFHSSSFEQMYVCHIKTFYAASSPQEVFKFHHENLTQSPDAKRNERFVQLSFENTVDFSCHGFAGYFDAILFGDYKMSIHPERASQGLCSWFPAFFPLKTPIFVKSGQGIKINFWRKVDHKRVWYEWAVVHPVVTQIHNTNGRSHSIPLS